METNTNLRLEPGKSYKPTREVFRALMLDYIDAILREDPNDTDARAIRADVTHPVRGEQLYQAWRVMVTGEG